MSSRKEEPKDKEYTLLLIPKDDFDLFKLMEDIKRNKIIPIYIELNVPRVSDCASGRNKHLAEIIIKKGD